MKNPRIHSKTQIPPNGGTKPWARGSSTGYDDKNGPTEVDASGLLSICIFSKYIQGHIAQIQNFEKVRDIRNTTLHAANYEVDTQTANNCLDAMIAVLSDTRELHMDKEAQIKCAFIQKLKSGLLQMPIDILEYVNAFALRNTNADDEIRDLQKKIADYVNQAKDEMNVVKCDAVQTLKNTTKEGVASILEKQGKAENSINAARTKAVNALTSIKTEAIGTFVNSARMQELEKIRIEEEVYSQKKN
ncbi:hypothetical protein MAR_002538, partial [Mya arenaria]